MRLVVSLPALTCLAQALTPNLALAQNQGQESWSTQPTPQCNNDVCAAG